MDSQSSWVKNRLLGRVVALFPKEKHSGIWLTVGIWYVNYFNFMRLITFGLYGRPRETRPESTTAGFKQSAAARAEGVRGLAPHPPSQYDENFSYEEWMSETIAFLRSIGFFQQFGDLDDLQVLDRLHQKREKETRDTWNRLINDDVKDQWIVEVKTDLGSSMEIHNDPQAFPGSIKYADYLRQQRDQALEQARFNRKDDLVDIWIAAAALPACEIPRARSESKGSQAL
jgi:hypothetical protein